MDIRISDQMSEFMPLSESEAKLVDDCIPVKTFKKGTLLLREGQVANESYFCIKGCVRMYYLVDGEEKTTFFYTEEQAIAPMKSYINRIPADHYLECVEDTTLAVLSYDKEQELYKHLPGFESVCRVSMEDDFGKQQDMIASYITNSPEQRYLNLMKNRPELLNRVPQYHLASYLGVKPESLSRIRKRVSQK